MSVGASRKIISEPMNTPNTEESSKQDSPGLLRSLGSLVAWLMVPALLLGGVAAIVSDFADWDLALGIGGSAIPVPKDRYAGIFFLMLSGGLYAVLRLWDRLVAAARANKVVLLAGAALVVIGLLIGGKAMITALDGGPAVSAAMNGDTDTLEALFDAGEVDPEDHGAMMAWAAQHGDLPTLRLLLEHELDPNGTRPDGTPAFNMACHYGGPEAVDLLKSAGATGECETP